MAFWGELQVQPLTDFAGRFIAGEVLLLAGRPYSVEHAQGRNETFVVLKLEGVDSLQDAQNLRGESIFVTRDRVPSLPQGQYYYFQLMDMEVYTSEGEHLGHISEIVETGSNDVYVVTRGNQEILIPSLDDVIQTVDVDAHRMVVELPQGLR